MVFILSLDHMETLLSLCQQETCLYLIPMYSDHLMFVHQLESSFEVHKFGTIAGPYG